MGFINKDEYDEYLAMRNIESLNDSNFNSFRSYQDNNGPAMENDEQFPDVQVEDEVHVLESQMLIET